MVIFKMIYILGFIWNILLLRSVVYPVGAFPTILSVSYYLHYNNGNLLKWFCSTMRVHIRVIFLVENCIGFGTDH